MPDPILNALDDLRARVTDNHRDLTARLDLMVTRHEHDAEVRRIDTEARCTREALTRHETTAEARIGALVQAMEADRAERTQADEARAKARAKAATDAEATRREDRRHLLMIIITAAGLAGGLGGGLTQLLDLL